MMPGLAIFAGIAILGATAHVMVMSTGGYTSDHALIVLAVAGGVSIAAICIGGAFSEGRHALGIGMLICLIAGEAYGLISTAERIVSARDTQQAPIGVIAAQRTAALDRVIIAERAKAAADAAVRASAAQRGCASNCRALLESAITAAAADLDRARRAVADVPVIKGSATPLADRVGVSGWMLDLIQAGLASIGANGLGACLLAYGSRRRPGAVALVSQVEPVEIVAPVVETVSPNRPVVLLPASPVIADDARQHVSRFLSTTIAPAPGAAISLRGLHRRYNRWCREKCLSPLAPGVLANELGEIFEHLNLRWSVGADDAQIVGARLVE